MNNVRRNDAAAILGSKGATVAYIDSNTCNDPADQSSISLALDMPADNSRNTPDPLSIMGNSIDEEEQTSFIPSKQEAVIIPAQSSVANATGIIVAPSTECNNR